jgi:osmoprotectant transport system substrate-binding protein
VPRLRALLCLLAAGAVVSACGEKDEGGPETQPRASGSIQRDAANAGQTITVGSKNFTEQRVLAELYAQGLEAAGFKVRRKLGVGDERVTHNALRRRAIDAYPEYTGTALLSLCDVPPADVPSEPFEAFEQARDCMAEDGLTAYPPTPFTSSNEVGVTRRTAQRHKLKKISDLKRVERRFTLYGSPECRRRFDCLRGLREVYGLRFRRFKPTEIPRRHVVLRNGSDVASIVFTTDPQVRREGIVLLDDDKGMFPPYNSTFLVRDDVAERAGDSLATVLEEVQRGLTDEVMQELNARVDLDHETPDEVAGGYLRDAGVVG